MQLIKIASAQDPRIGPYCAIRERDLLGRDGCFIAEGKVVLSVLMRSTVFEPESLLILENRLDGAMDLLTQASQHLPALQDLPVYIAPQSVMDAITGFHVHRGLLGVGKRKISSSSAPFNGEFAQDCLIVVASGISNHDNVGALFRNAAAFEVDGIMLDQECCDPLYRKSLRVSVGAALQVPFHRVGTLQSIVEKLSAQGFEIAALSPAGTRSVKDLPKTGKRAIILGSEGHGLPKQILDQLSTWSVPMSERFDSLNVATASGIALFHASRFSLKP